MAHEELSFQVECSLLLGFMGNDHALEAKVMLIFNKVKLSIVILTGHLAISMDTA